MVERAATQRVRDVWLAAGLLACVVVMSAAIAAALAFGVTDSPGATIVLGTGGGSREDAPAAGSAEAAVAQASDNPGILVRDEGGKVWTAESVEVNLFLSEYDDGNGNTVASADGDGVVAPGTANEYKFAVQNVADSKVTYTLSAQMTSDAAGEKVPLEARVKSSGGWLVGDDDEWIDMSELGVLESSAALAGRKSSSYSLEWRWRFERDDASKGELLADSDSHDTRLGNLHLSQSEDPVANVKLNVVASYDEMPDNATPSADTPASAVGGLPRTGDSLTAIALAAVALAIGAGALLLLLAHRPRERRRDSQGEDAEDGARRS